MTELLIPRATHPLAKYWQQPRLDLVLVDGQVALVPREAFEQLQDRTGKRPELERPGLMWRVMFRGRWWLMWYEQDPLEVDHAAVRTNWRELLVLE